MKIAIVGGASLRTPLLARALDASTLPIDELALYDIDQDRLGAIAGLASRMCARASVRVCASSADCVRDARYIFISIRVGGIARRIADERLALSQGLVGQETVGAAGFALALRTIGPVLEYAHEIAALAPEAWLINFTNPVGIVTQAITTNSGARTIGICDTPTELFHETAAVLGLNPQHCFFDYVGLNHLGWLREVYHDGRPQLDRLWRDPSAIARIYRAPLFDPEAICRLRMLPTEYLYYYERSDLAVERLRASGTTRGEAIEALNRRFLAGLAQGGADLVDNYDDYLAARSAGYMRLESGSVAPEVPTADRAPASPTGYDRIALSVVEAIYHDRRDIVPLDVPNAGNLAGLEPDDVVEVPCVVGANGALPLHVESVPDTVRPLMLAVKAYERLTIRATVERSTELAREALAANPLVGSHARADALLERMPLPW